MPNPCIKQVYARQVMGRKYPAVSATVITEGGVVTTGVCSAGVSVGTHEVPFSYDGGEKWKGKGLMNAIHQVNDIIATCMEMANDYNFVSIEDDVEEIKRAIDEGVVNSVALTVCGFETFSDVVEVVRYVRAAECGILTVGDPAFEPIGTPRPGNAVYDLNKDVDRVFVVAAGFRHLGHPEHQRSGPGRHPGHA